MCLLQPVDSVLCPHNLEIEGSHLLSWCCLYHESTMARQFFSLFTKVIQISFTVTFIASKWWYSSSKSSLLVLQYLAWYFVILVIFNHKLVTRTSLFVDRLKYVFFLSSLIKESKDTAVIFLSLLRNVKVFMVIF
jgi:hypothetical protein